MEHFHVDAYNNFLDDKAREMAALVRLAVGKYTKAGTGELKRRIRARTKKTAGMVDRISFAMPRYGVFFHKGVRRGVSANAAGRKENPFLNEVLDEEVPQLTQQLTDFNHEAILNVARIIE